MRKTSGRGEGEGNQGEEREGRPVGQKGAGELSRRRRGEDGTRGEEWAKTKKEGTERSLNGREAEKRGGS